MQSAPRLPSRRCSNSSSSGFPLARSTSASYFVPVVVLRRHLSLIWVLAALLIGGTQFQHAYADLTCHGDHAADSTQEQHEDTECPVEHACCHAHSPAYFSTPDDAGSLSLTPSVRPLPTRNQYPAQGPSREIDYPPQLS